MHSFTVHLDGESGALVEAQVVQAHLGMPLAAIFNEIYDLNLDGRLRTEMLIVRLPVEEAWDQDEIEKQTSERSRKLFKAPETFGSGTFDRVRDRSVHILSSYNAQHTLTGNLNPHWSDDPLNTYLIKADQAISAIRKAEFDYILDRSRAVITSPPGSRYLTPSKRLVRSFVRVGNIQYHRDAIDAVFFWLLPYLPDVGAILTDTWSISSIAFNIAKLCAYYFGGEPRCVEMLPSYDDGSEASRRRSRGVVERLDADCSTGRSTFNKVLFLISATQTGSLAKNMEVVFSTSALTLEPRFVAIFALGKHDIPCLHDLSSDQRFVLLEDYIDRPSEPVSIDSQVYFPLQFEDSVIQLDKALADRSRFFFDRYAGKGIIEVHRDHHEDVGRPRHHAIHLATERLLQVSEFTNKFETYLRGLPSPPLFIVSPPHQAGQLLANYAHQYFAAQGHQCSVFAHPNLYLAGDPITEDERILRSLMKEASERDALLVIDDVCITGTRLSQYQRYIRTERFSGRIDYLVGIARPSHPRIWDNLVRYLRFRGNGLANHTVGNLDFLLLPDWRHEDCPWCREKRLYESWTASGTLPDLLAARLERLSRSTPSGLAEDIFLGIPGLPQVQLGPNSLFIHENASQAEVFAAVAAAIQHLRCETGTDRPRLGPRHFPVSTVLDHRDYLRSKWTDSILRATFLRAASVDELTYADAERENERTLAVRELLIQPAVGEHDVALEILLAANMQKCRITNTSELLPHFQQYGVLDVATYLTERLTQLEPRAA